MRAHPATKFLKAVDSQTQEMLGQATWLVLDKPLEPEQLEVDGYDTEDDKEFSRLLHEQQMRYRIGASREANGHLLVLDSLAVRAEHRRKGVGSKLIQWGTKIADEMGLDAVVEASMEGAPVYKKHGFESMGKMTYDMPAKFEQRRTPDLLFMKRLSRQNASSSA
ncbi:MAG: hypothetical protein Q9222_001323 [Ikaeria aurantiellina]